VNQTLTRIGTLLLVVVLAAQSNVMGAERALKAEASGFLNADSRAVIAEGRGTHFGHMRLDVEVGDSFPDQDVLFVGFLSLFDDDSQLFAQPNTFVPVDPDTGVAEVTVQFAGGTGRFEGATGTATLTFRFTIDASGSFFNCDVEIEGTVDY
jgi:hypothetical protein